LQRRRITSLVYEVSFSTHEEAIAQYTVKYIHRIIRKGFERFILISVLVEEKPQDGIPGIDSTLSPGTS